MENLSLITQLNIIILFICLLQICWITIKIILNIIDSLVHKVFGNPWNKRPTEYPTRAKRKE